MPDQQGLDVVRMYPELPLEPRPGEHGSVSNPVERQLAEETIAWGGRLCQTLHARSTRSAITPAPL